MEVTDKRTLILEGTDLSDTARARRFVRRHAENSVNSDLELATSELVSNAIQYGAEGVTVIVHHDADGVSVTVENEVGGDDVPDDVSSWTIGDPAARSGRGLAIVRAVSDHVELVREGRRLSITAHIAGGSER
jgi:anti-sigma regulatory factor (Ser/Thr protein kinase)